MLFTSDGVYKLCDFGSAISVNDMLPSQADKEEIEEEINKNTTFVYRAPEMLDLYSGKPMNKKVDIWVCDRFYLPIISSLSLTLLLQALGCLLYKLCFFIDAFDDGGKLSIINGTVDFPDKPYYSKGIIDLISK